jgi:hypothetical protein
MKKIILLSLLGLVILSSCKQSKQDLVEDLITATNKFDKEKVGQLLSDSLIYINEYGVSAKKADYIKLLDSLKKLDIKNEIISIDVKGDSIIKTVEKYTTILDSFLLNDDTTKFLIHKNYLVRDGKILSIKVDTSASDNKFSESLKDRINILFLFAEDSHREKDKETIYKKMKEYLSEYSKLSTSEKKEYRNYSYIQGKFIIDTSNSGKIDIAKDEMSRCMKLIVALSYAELTFKGKRTVTGRSIFINLSYNYDLDENYIRIQGSEGFMLTLLIKDRNTLVSEDYGITYIRVK